MTADEELQHYLVGAFTRAPISSQLGLTLTYDDKGCAVVDMPRRNDFDHGMGDTHGGVFAILLDSAGWFTVAAQIGRSTLTADLALRLLAPARQRALTARAHLVWQSKRSAIAEMQLHADGQLIATANGSFVLGDPIVPGVARIA